MRYKLYLLERPLVLEQITDLLLQEGMLYG